MGDLLGKKAAWLADQRHQHLTQTVYYERPGFDQLPLAATVGHTEFELVDDVGAVQKIEARDYLIRTEDLAFGGKPTLPQAGDQIIEASGLDTFRYEVMAMGDQPPYRYSDSRRLTLRIHTKLVGT